MFLDEPTVGVDPQSRNHIFDSLAPVNHDGVTILYTTHYMEEAERLCDRVAIMDLGRVLALDTVGALVGRHGGRSTITFELDGDPPDGVTLPAQPDGSVLSFETDEPIAELQRLADRGVAFRSLHVDRPDLESVFLELTGKRLRD